MKSGWLAGIRFPLHLLLLAGGWAWLSAKLEAAPGDPGGFRYFVGIVGNPSVPDIRWSDEQLEQIKALGVNTIQLSIAWGHKPAGEVLNLEDLDAGQRQKFAFRIGQAKKHGLRTMAHFGIPKLIRSGPVSRPASSTRRSGRNTVPS